MNKLIKRGLIIIASVITAMGVIFFLSYKTLSTPRQEYFNNEMGFSFSIPTTWTLKIGDEYELGNTPYNYFYANAIDQHESVVLYAGATSNPKEQSCVSRSVPVKVGGQIWMRSENTVSVTLVDYCASIAGKKQTYHFIGNIENEAEMKNVISTLRFL